MNEIENLNFLIIDDDELYALKLSSIIEPFSKNITISETAENGSHFVAKLKPTIIFLDNNLPRLNGLEVIELYKEISPKSKLIFMSSDISMEVIEETVINKADYIFDKAVFNRQDFSDLMNSNFLKEKITSSLWKLLRVYEQKSVRMVNIAIVEDDELFSHDLNHTIQDICTNSNLNSFENGLSFIESSKDNNYDLVFLDYFLTDTTGKEVLVQISEIMPKARVIVISSLSDPKIATEIVNKGISGYIMKNKDWKSRLEDYLEVFGFN